MTRYTSILLPLASSKRKLLEEAARSRGASLESFVLSAAEAEAERIGAWVMENGHQIDHPIYAGTEGAEDGSPGSGAMLHDWQETIDEMIAAVDSIDNIGAAASSLFDDGEGTRRGPRRPIVDVRLLNPVFGRVVDMSALGLGIETFRPFSVPEQTVLSIGKTQVAAKIRAEVRWCLLVRTERIENGDIVPVYRSGLAFAESCQSSTPVSGSAC